MAYAQGHPGAQVALLRGLLREEQERTAAVQERYNVTKFLCMQLRAHVQDLLRDAGTLSTVVESARACTALLDSFPAWLEEPPSAPATPARNPFTAVCQSCCIAYPAYVTFCGLCGSSLAPMDDSVVPNSVSPIRVAPPPVADNGPPPLPETVGESTGNRLRGHTNSSEDTEFDSASVTAARMRLGSSASQAEPADGTADSGSLSDGDAADVEGASDVATGPAPPPMVSVPAEEPEPSPPAASPPASFCAACGAGVTADAKFCCSCGATCGAAGADDAYLPQYAPPHRRGSDPAAVAHAMPMYGGGPLPGSQSWAAGTSKRYPAPEAKKKPKKKKGRLFGLFGSSKSDDEDTSGAAGGDHDNRRATVAVSDYTAKKFLARALDSRVTDDSPAVQSVIMLPKHLVSQCMYTGCPTKFSGLFSASGSNCMNCGRIFCSEHITRRMKLPHRGHNSPVKVCAFCDAELKGSRGPRQPLPVQAAAPPPPPDPALDGITSSSLRAAVATLRDEGMTDGAMAPRAAPDGRNRSMGFDGDPGMRKSQSMPDTQPPGDGGGPHWRAPTSAQAKAVRVRGSSVLADIAEQINLSDDDSEPGEDVVRPQLTARTRRKGRR